MLDEHDSGRGGRIHDLRRSRAMTQEALATAAGVSVQTVRRAEAGRPLSLETAGALCSVLGTTMADLDRAAAGPSPAAAPAPDATPRVAASPRWPVPRPRASTWIVAALVALGAWSQARAWPEPGPYAQDWFRVDQAISQTALATALAVALARRARRAPGVARKAAACVAATCMACLPPALLSVGCDATAKGTVDTLRGWTMADNLVKVRSILEPAWDPAEARWEVRRRFQRGLGTTSPHIETPGTLAAFEAERDRCRDLFLHAASYPRDACGTGNARILQDRWGQLWKSFVGASFAPDQEGPGFDDIVASPGFAEARAIVAAHSDVVDGRPVPWWGEAMRDARRIAASRRAGAP